jgi:hypothetical protein
LFGNIETGKPEIWVQNCHQFPCIFTLK